jgi:hypothetical protein
VAGPPARIALTIQSVFRSRWLTEDALALCFLA